MGQLHLPKAKKLTLSSADPFTIRRVEELLVSMSSSLEVISISCSVTELVFFDIVKTNRFLWKEVDGGTQVDAAFPQMKSLTLTSDAIVMSDFFSHSDLPRLEELKVRAPDDYHYNSLSKKSKKQKARPNHYQRFFQSSDPRPPLSEESH